MVFTVSLTCSIEFFAMTQSGAQVAQIMVSIKHYFMSPVPCHGTAMGCHGTSVSCHGMSVG